MEDLAGQCARLSLHAKECQTIPLAQAVEDNNRILVAKLFTKRRVNVEALSQTLKTMWRFVKDFEVRDLTSNKVLLLFADDADMQKILSQGPWTFDKYLIGLYKPGAKESVDDANFDTASFWIQIHDLPLCRMNRTNVATIGNTLGTVEQVDASPTGECRGRCLRVRVNINITQPLCRGRYVDLGDSEPHWISFQYERMPIFCYWCGVLNHNERDCKLWSDSGETLNKEDQQYGPWLRATMTNVQPSQVVHTKTAKPSAPPRPHRPTPSPSMRPSPPVVKDMHPPPEQPNIIQPAAAVICAETPDSVPSNTEILSDPTLFNAHIMEIDKVLNYFPNSNLTNPLTQLAPSTVTETSLLPFLNSTKSAIPSKENPETLNTIHPNIPHTIPEPHITETLNPDIPETQKTTTSPTCSTPTVNTGPPLGTWRRLGPPRQIMDTSDSSDHPVGPKRKTHATHADTLHDKKQKLSDAEEKILHDKKQQLLDDEAKTLGKLMADNLGSAVAAWQHYREQ
ncbi:hypothetical protein CMV_022403 [Castanea mollissima]|uniref:DUF4283 domain-containing protein n=1 Tax=Castanea mollissima TaxID=60419 RepID=A0A8J4VBN2_9ROSI|nr:hypothetical protein CMV_022403 [Castanea mollissima]